MPIRYKVRIHVRIELKYAFHVRIQLQSYSEVIMLDGYDKGEWGDAQFTLKAKVPKKNINWFATILHNLYWGEDEITTKNNIKIDVDEVIEGESPTAPSGQR